MGSRLGLTFAEFFMCNLENKIVEENPYLLSNMYARYAGVYAKSTLINQLFAKCFCLSYGKASLYIYKHIYVYIYIYIYI